ncbi:MAG: hypothetical protein SVJ22_09730 [Halobacteriota archaeon]|nr:hypothetical protein [Halobacteriota archaeon]
MKSKYKYGLIFGSALIILVNLLSTYSNDIGLNPSIISVLTAVGFVLIVSSVVRHKVYGEGIEKDERSETISAYALSYSWMITLIYVAVLILLEEFEIFKTSTALALCSTIFIMVASVVVSEWHLKRGGGKGIK